MYVILRGDVSIEKINNNNLDIDNLASLNMDERTELSNDSMTHSERANSERGSRTNLSPSKSGQAIDLIGAFKQKMV